MTITTPPGSWAAWENIWHFTASFSEALQCTQVWHLYSISFLFRFFETGNFYAQLCADFRIQAWESQLWLSTYKEKIIVSANVPLDWFILLAYFLLVRISFAMIMNKHISRYSKANSSPGPVTQQLQPCLWLVGAGLRSWPGTRVQAATATAPHQAETQQSWHGWEWGFRGTSQGLGTYGSRHSDNIMVSRCRVRR